MKCRCGRKAVFCRVFEGRHLCELHFFQSLERKVKRTIARNRMVEKEDVVAVALSGGKDSSLTLYLMHKIFGKRPDIKIFAVTVDEGTGLHRKKAIELAEGMCKKLGIPHYLYSFKEEFGTGMREKMKKIKSGKGYVPDPCTYCGIARRYLLNKKARELGATKLCIGTNLDDEVQSILMNQIRGDLNRGARLGPVNDYSVSKSRKRLFIPRIKPLREVPENETALYCMLKGFSPSYRKCPYADGLRFEVRDFLNSLEKNHAGVKYSILHSFDKLLPCLRKLSESGEQDLTVCKKCGEPGSGKICKTCELWR
jgi:uncharacterized protein (TIGR00269 family)